MKRHVAEGAGAFFLTLAYLLMQANAAVRDHAPATLGLLLLGLTLVVRHMAPAQFNPAVSIAGWVSGRIARPELSHALLAQLAGAVAAGAIASWLLNSEQAAAAAAYQFPQRPSLEVVFVELLSVALIASAYWILFFGKKKGEGAAGVSALFYALLRLFEPFGAAINPAFLVGALIVGAQDGELILTRLFGMALGIGLAASLLIALDRDPDRGPESGS
ncbi:MAG: aquaporin [Saprospiraceae bacterium]